MKTNLNHHPFSHLTIKPFSHITIKPFNHSAISPFNHQTISTIKPPPITASHITYYHLCHRKLWLHHRGIRQEDNSAAVQDGILIGETSYRRRSQKWRELPLEGIKIDHFDPQTNTLKEVKRSPKLESAHIAQVQYYLFRLEEAGMRKPKGIIEYPKQKRSRTVELSDPVRREITAWLDEIERISSSEKCPPVIKKAYCQKCAFRDFCYV